MKVIEGMRPWEVMKAFEEGKRIAIKRRDYHGEFKQIPHAPEWNWIACEYAVIDDTKPEKEKPPIGLIPKKLYIRQRALEIIAAMDRYAQANKPIPAEWFDELRDLTEAV